MLVVATAFNKEGICAVLTGGAAAAIHTGDCQKHEHLNYALTSPASASRLASAIRHLGFELERPNIYRHAAADVILELTQAPLALGRNDEVVAQTMQLRHGFVRILSPTDCCREQLLQWRATQDDSGMENAVGIAVHCDINMPVMRGWMRKERIQGAWSDFKRSVQGTTRAAPPAEPRLRASRLR